MSDEAQATVDKRIKQYIDVREAIKAMNDKHADELKPLIEIQSLLTGWITAFLDKAKAESVKTAHGTAYTSVRHTASLEDPDQFMKYVIANQKFDLLDRRANSTACRDFADANGSLPPGVKLSSLATIGVRKK